MKRFIFLLLGLIAGIVIINFFYLFLSIPLIPCAAVWASFYICLHGYADSSGGRIPTKIIVSLVSIVGIIYYGWSLYRTIAFFPQYGNVLAIIFDFLTIIAFISAWVMVLSALSKSKS